MIWTRLTIDHGARLVPSGLSRFEPVFHALNSPADLGGVQLITDRNSLRKIYGIFNPDGVYGPKPFRIDAQLVADVVLFTRWEKADKRQPAKPHPFCYSKSHELATMRSQLKGAVACHRLVRYEFFGGIDILVRFELDAVTDAVAVATKVSSASASASTKMADIGLETLPGSLANMSISNKKNTQLPLPPIYDSKAGIKIYRTTYPSPPFIFIHRKEDQILQWSTRLYRHLRPTSLLPNPSPLRR